MKRLNDSERFVQARRLLSQIKPLVAELEELLATTGTVTEEEKEKVLNMDISEFFCSKEFQKRYRVINAAGFLKIKTVRELTMVSRSEILRCHNIGEKVLQQIEDILGSYGLSFVNP